MAAVDRVHVAPAVGGYMVALVDVDPLPSRRAARRQHPRAAVAPAGGAGLRRHQRPQLREPGGRQGVSCVPVMAHRMSLTADAIMRGVDVDHVLAEVLDTVDVPRRRSDEE